MIMLLFSVEQTDYNNASFQHANSNQLEEDGICFRSFVFVASFRSPAPSKKETREKEKERKRV